LQGALGLIGRKWRNRTRRVLDRFLEKHHLEPLEFQAGADTAVHRLDSRSTEAPSGENLPRGDAAGHVKVTTVGALSQDSEERWA